MPARPKLAGLLVAAFLIAPAAARAKVVFTGYGDFRLNAHTPFRIDGDAPALTKLNTSDTGEHHTRGFSFDSVGLFASTSLTDDLDFLVDFNYRNIGTTVGQLRLQYAYLEGRAGDNVTYRAGKITLPFGYYNQNRFYPFQRAELQSPIFQSAILGLPIADLGAGAQERLPRRGVTWVFDEYAVNGYGSQPNSPSAFRSPSVLGGLAFSNNLGSTNNNANIAFGGRVGAADIAGRPIQAGLSYYGGAWDTGGSHYLQMYNAYFHSGVGRLDFLAELLHLDVSGDPGFAAVVDDTHWQTSGYFMTAGWSGLTALHSALTPYVGSEGYVSESHNGKGSQEKLQAYRAGAQLKPVENVALKAEYAYLYYTLPVVGSGNVRLWAHELLAAVVFTF